MFHARTLGDMAAATYEMEDQQGSPCINIIGRLEVGVMHGRHSLVERNSYTGWLAFTCHNSDRALTILANERKYRPNACLSLETRHLEPPVDYVRTAFTVS
jgi:hypothetical protein